MISLIAVVVVVPLPVTVGFVSVAVVAGARTAVNRRGYVVQWNMMMTVFLFILFCLFEWKPNHRQNRRQTENDTELSVFVCVCVCLNGVDIYILKLLRGVVVVVRGADGQKKGARERFVIYFLNDRCERFQRCDMHRERDRERDRRANR